MNNVVLLSLSIEELKDIVRDAVKEELNLKKEKELMSFKETCELLNISATTLNHWMKINKIPYKRLGTRIYFCRTEVLNTLQKSNYYKLRELIER